MAISLSKAGAGVGLTRVCASLTVPDGSDGDAARLTVMLHEGERGAPTVVDHRNMRSADGAVALTKNGADSESVEMDLTRLPTTINAIAICVSLIGNERSSVAARGALRLLDFAQGEEIGRYDLNEIGCLIAYEFGCFERAAEGWHYRSTGRDPGEAFERAVRRDPPITRASAAGTSSPATQRPRDPQDAFRDAIGARGLSDYCDVAERDGLLREGARLGLDAATAQALLDLTLERRGIANEATLRERLHRMLRQFTDKDRKLDPKEQSDALQMVCKPAPGYAKGLRADIADREVIEFCRARGVKVKTGWLGWKVP